MVRSSSLLFALAVALALAGCEPQDVALACPRLRQYDQATQQRALAEYQALPKGSAIKVMFGDYAALREQVRICQAFQK